MSSLADQVIQANEEENRQLESDLPKIDDIGFPLPKPQTEKAHCEYLTARILYLNNRMYKHQGMLWLHNEVIPETKNSYYTLAKYPKKITDPENSYVWRRLKELVPRLNTDIVAVLPGMTFNMVTGEFKFEDVWTTTPWDKRYED